MTEPRENTRASPRIAALTETMVRIRIGEPEEGKLDSNPSRAAHHCPPVARVRSMDENQYRLDPTCHILVQSYVHTTISP